MAAVFALLAGAIVVLHMAFVVSRLPEPVGAPVALDAIHLPAAARAAYIELTGGICPLTPIENTLPGPGSRRTAATSWRGTCFRCGIRTD